MIDNVLYYFRSKFRVAKLSHSERPYLSFIKSQITISAALSFKYGSLVGLYIKCNTLILFCFHYKTLFVFANELVIKIQFNDLTLEGGKNKRRARTSA